MNETETSFDFDEYARQHRLEQQNTQDLLNDFADSVNVSRARARELEGFVAVNHEFLDGTHEDESKFFTLHDYSSDLSIVNGATETNTPEEYSRIENGADYAFSDESKIVNGTNYNAEIPEERLVNGAITSNVPVESTSRLEDGSKTPTIVTIEDKKLESADQATPPEVGNMSNAYSYSASPEYMASEFAKTTVKDTDAYETMHTTADLIRMVQGITAVADYRTNKDSFLDFSTSDTAKEVNEVFKELGTSFDAFSLKDESLGMSLDNLKYANDRELSQAFESGKRQIEKTLLNQGLDLRGIKNTDIATSIEHGHFNFGSQKNLKISPRELKLLRAYLELDNIQLSMNKESARAVAANQVFKNRAKVAIKGTDTYRGFRQVGAIKRAGGRVIFTPVKGAVRLTSGVATFNNRLTNARYSVMIKRATSANKAQLSAKLLAKNNKYHSAQASRNRSLGKISSVEHFLTSSSLEKVRIISGGVSNQFKKTDLYKNSFGKLSATRNKKKLERQMNNPKKYQKKQLKREKRKTRKRKFAYFKKKAMIYAAFAIGGIIIIATIAEALITIYLGETPYSGDKLISTEYNPVRQHAIDESILSLQKAQNWIINQDGNYYTGSLYQVTIKYPNRTTKTYTRGSGDPAHNLNLLFPDGDKSNIKKLRIPWTYQGTAGGETLNADGYLGQSIYDDIYQLDDNDEIIDDAPPLSRPRELELYSDVINMPIPDGWISAFSTRPQYNYQNWNNSSTYMCSDAIRRYSLDDFYKAISSMAVEVCDITGYDDVDGHFYEYYFKAISDMAIKNSFYTINVTTVPKPGFMQYKDDDNTVFSDNAYLVHCQVYIHLDASINDLMELADHYDPINRVFTNRTASITAWRNWIAATIAATGADNTGYEASRVYNGFYTADSPSFLYDNNYGCYRDVSGFAYNYSNMNDEANSACSYLFEGLTLKEWVDDLGFVFLNAYSIDGNNVSNMAPIYSAEQIEDYLIQIKSYYYQQTGLELSDARLNFMRQCLSDVGRFYYAFGGKATNINDPPVGLDCSGFVGYELAKAGLISNPAQSTASLNGAGMGRVVSYLSKKPGDVIVKYDPANDTDLHWSSHVVIYLGKFDAGDGKGVVEHTVECTTSTVSGSQVFLMSKRTYEKGYDCVKRFMD